MKKLLNIEYAGIQMLYWMAYAMVATFASAFLLGRGYSNSEIGVILAVGNVVAVIIQPGIGTFADRSKRFSVPQITAVMAFIILTCMMLCIILDEKSIVLSVIFILLVALHMTLQPLFNSIPAKFDQFGVHVNFGVARGMGSLAFSCLVVVLGRILEKADISILPMTGMVFTVALIFCLLSAERHSKKARKVYGDKATENKCEISVPDEKAMGFAAFIGNNKVFFIMNIGVIALYFHNVVLNNYMLQIVTNVGGGSGDMGVILAVMALCEVPVMFCFDRLRKRFTCQFMLKVSAVFFVVRIIVCYLANSVTMVLISQLFEILSFGLFLPAMVRFIDEAIRKREVVKGQSLYTTMVSVSTVLASLLGGVILDLYGAKMLLLLSTVATIAGAVVVFATVDKIRK